MEEQFPRACDHCHVMKAKIQTLFNLELSILLCNKNSLKSDINAMSFIE